MGSKERESRRRREKRAKRLNARRQVTRSRSKPATKPVLRRATPFWIADPSRPCPCGTGRQYVECCQPNVPEGVVGVFDPEDAPSAERAWRASLTKYLGNTFKTTLPAVEDGHPVAPMFVKVDVDAIEYGVEMIAFALRAQERSEEVIALVDHVVQMVPLPGLAQRLLAFKAAWIDGVLKDKRRAQRELESVDPSRETDLRLLEAYSSINLSEDTFARIRFLQRILEIARLEGEPYSFLYHATALALHLFMIGDKAGASALFVEGLGSLSDRKPDEATFMECITLARAYQLKGKIEASDDDLRASLEWWGAIDLDEMLAEGKADIHHQIGCVLGDLGDHTSAATQFDMAIKLGGEQASQIRLADELMRSGQTERFTDVLAALDRGEVEPSLRLEYLIVRAAAAMARRDKAELRKAIDDLRALALPEAYFDEQRNRLCVDLLTLLDRTGDPWSADRSSRMLGLLRGFANVCEFLELKPNIFGLGVNLNRLIEKFKGREE